MAEKPILHEQTMTAFFALGLTSLQVNLLRDAISKGRVRSWRDVAMIGSFGKRTLEKLKNAFHIVGEDAQGAPILNAEKAAVQQDPKAHLFEATEAQLMSAGLPVHAARSLLEEIKSGRIQHWSDLRLVSSIGSRRIAYLQIAFSLEEKTECKDPSLELMVASDALSAVARLLRRDHLRKRKSKLCPELRAMLQRMGRLLDACEEKNMRQHGG